MTQRSFRDRVDSLLWCAFGGPHHVHSLKFDEESPGFARASFLVPSGRLATADGNALTILVFCAHDNALRVEISNGGPYYIKVSAWPRVRSGRLYERHPALEDAVAAHRSRGWLPNEDEEPEAKP